MNMTVETGGDRQDMQEAVRGFFEALLAEEEIGAVLVPGRLPGQATVMPALVTKPEQLAHMDPLAPCFAINGARVLTRLLRKPMGSRVAALLRPCEIRAFLELVKLHQARTGEVILVGMDCLGAMTNREYAGFAGDDPRQRSLDFCWQRLSGEEGRSDMAPLAPACRICELPVPEAADLRIGLYGTGGEPPLPVQSLSPKGEALLKDLGLPPADMPEDGARDVAQLVTERLAERDRVFSRTAQAIGSLGKMSAYFARCVNCHNCRVACPVCYCRECVFATDVFCHEPIQYLRWAGRRGALKMPTDTLFYHLTRLAHISTACVGCGQCSNACPNDIPVMEVFRTVAQRTQQAFGYQAGRSLEERPPLSEWREQEFEEVVGIEG